MEEREEAEFKRLQKAAIFEGVLASIGFCSF